jgi:hypothetical protein
MGRQQLKRITPLSVSEDTGISVLRFLAWGDNAGDEDALRVRVCGSGFVCVVTQHGSHSAQYQGDSHSFTFLNKLISLQLV